MNWLIFDLAHTLHNSFSSEWKAHTSSDQLVDCVVYVYPGNTLCTEAGLNKLRPNFDTQSKDIT